VSYVIDDKGLVHEVLDNRGTMCGSYHSAWATAEAGSVVTCFACMHPAISKDCGHTDARIGNCPYAADIHNDSTQRCKCCSDCMHQCALDI
jgi:flavoprotein